MVDYTGPSALLTIAVNSTLENAGRLRQQAVTVQVQPGTLEVPEPGANPIARLWWREPGYSRPARSRAQGLTPEEVLQVAASLVQVNG